MMKKKAKIVFHATDELWKAFKTAHRKKYPEDGNSMQGAVERAIEEFVK